MEGQYEKLLSNLEQTVQRCDLPNASRAHEELAQFVIGLSPADRHTLEAEKDLVGASEPYAWTRSRRERLKLRWSYLQLHLGSWAGWREALGKCSLKSDALDTDERAERERALNRAPPRLLDAARDLVYFQAPDAACRRILWSFCASRSIHGAIPTGFGARPLEAPPRGSYASDIEQIKRDACRTPHLTDEQKEGLVRVLWAWLHPDGAKGINGRQSETAENRREPRSYVQGIHMLAACPLWAGLSEREALSVLELVMESLCGGYYADAKFASFRLDSCVAEALLQAQLPKLKDVLASAELPTMLLLFDPLLCLFTHYLPQDTILRLWDVLLIEGDSVAVFAIILVLFEHLLPETASDDTGDAGTFTGDGFPIVERLQERSAAVGSREVEMLLEQVRELIDLGRSGPCRPRRNCDPCDGPFDAVDLHSRVATLRADAFSNAEKTIAGPSLAAESGWLESALAPFSGIRAPSFTWLLSADSPEEDLQAVADL